jgi:RHS repeat-associated protein
LADASAALTTQYTFEPFGAASWTGTASTNALQFSGRENDGTGMYSFRARYADSALGQFISEDPIGPSVGDSNLYRYVMSNPIGRIDPVPTEKAVPVDAVDVAPNRGYASRR